MIGLGSDNNYRLVHNISFLKYLWSWGVGRRKFKISKIFRCQFPAYVRRPLSGLDHLHKIWLYAFIYCAWWARWACAASGWSAVSHMLCICEHLAHIFNFVFCICERLAHIFNFVLCILCLWTLRSGASGWSNGSHMLCIWGQDPRKQTPGSILYFVFLDQD